MKKYIILLILKFNLSLAQGFYEDKLIGFKIYFTQEYKKEKHKKIDEIFTDGYTLKSYEEKWDVSIKKFDKDEFNILCKKLQDEDNSIIIKKKKNDLEIVAPFLYVDTYFKIFKYKDNLIFIIYDCFECERKELINNFKRMIML
ncbi:hypothetical protein [Flavobacterium sp.]|jgi:hypothetical protein|uniref:hypothetical protein n=1 Tax=Flavobacterium sp. TaxID=239 RepID=UPI0037C0CEE3